MALTINTLYARYLGPAGLGWYTLAIYLPEMAAILLTLGLPGANVYLVGSGQVSAREALANSLGLGAVLTLAVGALYLLLLPSLQPAILRGIPLSLAALGTLSLPLTLAAYHANSILQAKQRLGDFSLVKIVQGLCCLAFSLILVVALNLGPLGALVSYLLAGGVALSVICWLLSFSFKPSMLFKCGTLKKQLSYGIKGHLGNLMQFFNYRIDILMVAYFLTPREVGLYSLATLMGESLWHVANAAQTALFPHIASSRESGEVTLQVLTGVVAITTRGGIPAFLPGATADRAVLLAGIYGKLRGHGLAVTRHHFSVLWQDPGSGSGGSRLCLGRHHGFRGGAALYPGPEPGADSAMGNQGRGPHLEHQL